MQSACRWNASLVDFCCVFLHVVHTEMNATAAAAVGAAAVAAAATAAAVTAAAALWDYPHRDWILPSITLLWDSRHHCHHRCHRCRCARQRPHRCSGPCVYRRRGQGRRRCAAMTYDHPMMNPRWPKRGLNAPRAGLQNRIGLIGRFVVSN